MWVLVKCARVLRPLTSILSVVSIIFQRELKQWLWKIPEVALEMNLGFDSFARVAMADLEKHRNGTDVVRRAERK